jgi:hypothetical protein
MLAPYQAGLRRNFLDRPLFGASGGCGLQAEDEYKRGHQYPFTMKLPSKRPNRAGDPGSIRGNLGLFSSFVLLTLAAGAARAESNDYPTSARADYVIGCMAANGNTREALLKCSCAIDTIASLMPYSSYEQAETALGLQAGGGVGGRVGLFRDPPHIKEVIEELHRAQAEANLRCR